MEKCAEILRFDEKLHRHLNMPRYLEESCLLAISVSSSTRESTGKTSDANGSGGEGCDAEEIYLTAKALNQCQLAYFPPRSETVNQWGYAASMGKALGAKERLLQFRANSIIALRDKRVRSQKKHEPTCFRGRW